MSTTTAKGSGSTVNNGGTVLAAGTLGSDTPMTQTLNVNELGTAYNYGSQVVANDGGATPGYTDPAGVTTAKAGGTGGLAYYPNSQAGERNFLMKAAGDSASKINNDSTTLLNIPGSEYAGVGRETIHKTVSTRRIGAYASTSFDVLAVPSSGVVPGRTRGANAGSASTFVQADGSTSAVDDAASPTRAVPGELTYHFGGLGRATTDEYKARDSYEPADDGSTQTTTTTSTTTTTTTVAP